MRGCALLSACGRYRYRLERRWQDDADAQLCAFIMLNPSTADAARDDPTIRRCIDFARSWGYGGLIVGNLFALRSTDPRQLRSAADPTGPSNAIHLDRIIRDAALVLCAWGTYGAHATHCGIVIETISFCGKVAQCLGTTASGQPRHPLYVTKCTRPLPLPAR
jgi:hypothetical protein